MINAGIKGSPDGFNWQSLEQRAENIKALSSENNIYSGALLFLDVHMHNEIVESLSTKGKIGLLVLIMFYVAMIYYCIREKKYILLVFLLLLCYLALVMSLHMLNQYRHRGLCASSCLYRF
ncbi:hypothetical protein O5268_02530 [Escherichia coli]|nr:hypothetical protein [Escherichia coli]